MLEANMPGSNLGVLLGLNGEPGWICLMCCNSDSKLTSIQEVFQHVH